MDNSNNSKLTNIIFYITISIFIVFVSLFSFLSFIQSSYMAYTSNNHKMIYKNFFTIRSLVFFVILIVFGILINIFNKRISSKKMLIIELVVFAIIGAIYCLSYAEINPQHDSKRIYEAAVALSQGSTSELGGKSHMGQYPNNLGVFSEYYFLIKIFGNNIKIFTYIRFINLLVALIGYLYVFKITDIIYKNNKINLYLLLLFLGFNHLILFTPFMYSNVLGYSFAIVSIYYLIYYLKNGKRLLPSFIFIVLSIVIRKNSLIILIAEIIVLLMRAFDKKKLINFIIVLLFFAGLLVPQTVVKFYESKYKVNYDYQLPTVTWLYYGLNYYDDTPGGFVTDFTNLYQEYDYNSDVIDNYGKAYFKSTMDYFKNNPLKFIIFNIKKFISAWCDYDYDVFTNTQNMRCTLWGYEPIMNDIYDAFLSMMSLGLLIYSFLCRKKKKCDFILILSVVGGFIFHLFWEIKAIYTYQYILLLLPLSAFGLEKFYDKLIEILYGRIN